MTAVGWNTAPWWAPRSSWEAEDVLGTETRPDLAGRGGPGDRARHHRPGHRRVRTGRRRGVRAPAGRLRRVHRRGGGVGDRGLPVLRRPGVVDAAGAVPGRQ